MLRCQNKFTDREDQNKSCSAIQKKYLSVDNTHLQKTQIVKDTNQFFRSSFSSVKLPFRKQIKDFIEASNIC